MLVKRGEGIEIILAGLCTESVYQLCAFHGKNLLVKELHGNNTAGFVTK